MLTQAREFASVADVHVHLFCLKSLAMQEPERAVLPLLNEPEIQSVGRIKSASRRAELLYGRVMLRRLLAAYGNCDSQCVALTTDIHGKPKASNTGLPTFNVSHAAGMLAIAVACGSNVGIDIERMSPDVARDCEGIARSQFAPAEHVQLMAHLASQRPDVFLRMWTLKEAILKAAGIGLLVPVSTVDVSGSEARLQRSIAFEDNQVVVAALHQRVGAGWHLAVARELELGQVDIFVDA